MKRIAIISPVSLGLVASGKRSIRAGEEYNMHFDLGQVEGNEVQLLSDGTVYDTLQQMQNIVRKTLKQTRSIAQKLKGKTREETCNNLFDFLYSHVQYKKDNPLREQLRTPARTWKDRRSGVDCDCYSIFISSVLTNLNIPHAFRMAGYKGDFQHVYVVVPKEGKTIGARNTYYVIDPVVNQFDYETPFNKKYDHMTKVTMLNGLQDSQDSKACRPVHDLLRRYVYTDQVYEAGYVPTKQFLEANHIPYEHIVNNETEAGSFAISTPSGIKQVPAILTNDQAAHVMDMFNGADIQSATPVTDAIAPQKKSPWWWVALGAAALVLLTGGDQNEVKTGLSGVNKNTKRKPATRKPKLRTLHI